MRTTWQTKQPALAIAALACLVPHAPGQEGKLAREPTFEEACANWPAVQYQCSVLSPKNSQSKFVVPFRGGAHTVYVSEVLGHCPLIPGRASLMAHLAEGIQVLWVTGEPPDFRIAPRADLKQRLPLPGVPLVETTWKSADAALEFLETTFVRQIGDRFDALRGDENAAAFIRLKVRNNSELAQNAVVRLCVNGSNNGQPRGASAVEFGTGLRLERNRLITPNGQTRLLWKTRDDLKMEATIRFSVPSVLVWDRPQADARACSPGDEPPFNRYFETRVDENHGGHKAFDRLLMTYWKPEQPLGEAVGIGLEFPEIRRVRQLAVRFDGDSAPRLDGFRVEYQNDGAWISIEPNLNGKSPAEWSGVADARRSIGPHWELTFAPVDAKRVRLLITGMPEGIDKPAVSELDIQYRVIRADPDDADKAWIDTAAGDYLGNHLAFRARLEPGSETELIAIVPYLPCDEQAAHWLLAQDVAKEAGRVSEYWSNHARQGARIWVPEPAVQERWEAALWHLCASTEIDPTNGLAITKTNVGWYEAVWPSLSASVILGLDLAGQHHQAELCLEPFLKWQGTIKPPGQYQSQAGFLAAADDYTWVRWTSGHGWLLMALCEHYRLSGDRGWLDRALPKILAACDWIERERKTTKRLDENGESPPHWGLLPRGVTGDGAPNCFSFFNEACNWRGLMSAAAVLRSIDHPRAKTLAEASREYRESINAAMRWASEHSPAYKLANGQTIPFIPIDLYNTFKINTDDPVWRHHPWWLDVGPLHTVDMGAVDAKSDLAGWMIQTAEDSWLKHSLALDEPWYCPQRSVYLERDEIDKLLHVYYNLMAEGMDRQVFAPVEGHGGVQNLPWGDGEHIRTLRSMLVQEKGESLVLTRAVPRAWLEQGKRIVVDSMPTYFGRVSYTIESDIRNQRILIDVSPPRDNIVPMRMCLRHPEGRTIQNVTVNSLPSSRFEGEWITLPATDQRLAIVAQYGD